MSLLSKEETLHYVRDILEVPINELPLVSGSSVPANVKVSFMENVLKNYLEREPFQSLTLMADDVENRHRPSWEEIKSNMFLGRGGLCYWHNTFMFVLLSSLGYDVVMSHSTVLGFDKDNHVVVIVRDLVTPGDLHIVDVGIGYYIPRPISIDFVHESPVFKDSIMTYKFRRESETKMVLLKVAAPEEKASKSGQNAQEAKQDGSVPDAQDIKWEVLYFFDPSERSQNLEDFFECFDICFTDVTKLPFHTSPRAMHWSNGKFIGIVNSKVLEEIEEGELTKTPIENQNKDDNSNKTETDPVLQAYAKYFPQFPTELVKAALKNWRSSQYESKTSSNIEY